MLLPTPRSMPKDIKDQLDFLQLSPEGYGEVPRGRHPVYNQHMFVQVFAMVVEELVVVASMIAAAAAGVEVLAVSEGPAETGAPVAGVEERIGLEAFVVVGCIVEVIQAVGL
jgi:hypothetical protein